MVNSNGSAGITPDDIYFSKPYIASMLDPYIEKFCWFNHIMNPIDITSHEFIYAERDFTVNSQIEDGIQSRPLPYGELSGLSEIKVKRSEMKNGHTYARGYKFRVSRDEINQINAGNDAALNDYNWALFSIGYGIAKDINANILAALTENATAPTASIAKTWGDSEATPIRDITHMGWAYKDKSLPNEMNTLFMETSAIQALLDYCDSKDIEWTHQGNAYVVGKTPLRGQTIYDVDDSIPVGSSLNLDLQDGIYMGADFYRCLDPKFSVKQGNDQDAQDKSSFQINIIDHQEAPHDRIIEAWINLGIAVRRPRVIQFQEGLMPSV